jgi:hypothetical protein
MFKSTVFWDRSNLVDSYQRFEGIWHLPVNMETAGPSEMLVPVY